MNDAEKPPSHAVSAGSRVRLWMKRLGLAGFLFFFVKGLVWLVVLIVGPTLLAKGCGG